MYTLSILDQSPMLKGDTAEQALQRTIKLARFADEKGFKRFWVSEHHQTKELAGSSPEILVAHLLAKTNKIRIGSGGVMLTHYSPYKVAENFHVLSSLAPGRVDLGVGKAPGGLPTATKALQYNGLSDPNDFYTRLKELQLYIKGDNSLAAEPAPQIPPEIVLLGGSAGSAEYAAQLGITYTFAQFINSNEEQLAEAIRVYKDRNPTGTFAVGIAVVAADSREEAKNLLKNTDLFRVHIEDGGKFTLTSFESAERFGLETGKKFTIETVSSPAIAGTASDIFEKFDTLHKSGIDEFIIHTPILEEEARFRSIELVSQHNAVSL